MKSNKSTLICSEKYILFSIFPLCINLLYTTQKISYKNIPHNKLAINFELPALFNFHDLLNGTTFLIVVQFNQFHAKLLQSLYADGIQHSLICVTESLVNSENLRDYELNTHTDIYIYINFSIKIYSCCTSSATLVKQFSGFSLGFQSLLKENGAKQKKHRQILFLSVSFQFF